MKAKKTKLKAADTNQSTNRITRINQWLSNHKWLVLALIAILALIVGVAAYYAFNSVEQQYFAPLKVKKPSKKYTSPLTGREVKDEATTNRQVTAIMLENSPEARPQSGLKEAGVVYEAIAEGGITRFLALYQETRPDLIGPVRSLRPYYLEWAAPYDAALAHIGGSAKALSEVRNGSYKDIDQFFNDGSYWRARDRAAPHNVYTNFDKLDELNKSKGFVNSNFAGFTRKPKSKQASTGASQISAPISSSVFKVNYDYDAKSNSYLRSVGGQAHNDREKGRIAPNVVIVLQVNRFMIQEDGYRESYQTSGNGKAWVFQEGGVTEISWSKASTKEPLQLIGADSKPFALIPGQTWITALDQSKTPSWQ